MRTLLGLLTIGMLAVFLGSGVYASTIPPIPHNKGTSIKKAVVKKKKKARRKRHKYVAPPQDELKVETMPLVLPISEEVSQALSKNNIEEAVRVLRTEAPSSKSLHLLKEMHKIISFEKSGRVPLLDRPQFYRNLGIAYHNLFLFLKRLGAENHKFYKQALKYYGKADNSRGVFDRYKAWILSAALEASNGNTAAAGKIFSKVDTDVLGDDYRSMEYVAAYHAAMGNVPDTIAALRRAHELNSQEVALWLAIGDDFVMIEREPQFMSLLAEWKI